MKRRPLVVGNWKMHGTLSESVVLTRNLQAQFVSFSATSNYPSIDVVIAPPFTALAMVSEQLNLVKVTDVHLPPRNNAAKTSERGQVNLRLELGAQNMNEYDSGAYTGEISAPMLHELGVRWVIIGHSERRSHFGELDAVIAQKVHAAIHHGITPIIAVGETADQHQAGLAEDIVTAQTRAALSVLEPEDIARCVVAYEPVWAIGSGKSDDPDRASHIMGVIRSSVEGLETARLLYGGSVSPENAAALFRQPHIDGGLIGGASLHPEQFVAIIQTADEAGKVFQR